MYCEIKSKILGKTFEFSRPGSGYIYVDLTGKNPGTCGQQICYGGGFRGNTVTYYGDDQKYFEKICRTWYRQYLKWERQYV